MKKQKKSKRLKLKAFTAWNQLFQAYYEWRKRPSYKVVCKIFVFLAKVKIKILTKRVLDWLFDFFSH